MRERSDQFVKNLFRDALLRMAAADTEVEVAAAKQTIDVWCIPDPLREAERRELGLLGELAAEPSLFEPFHSTPGLRHLRDCLRKQLAWHHELERRARTAAEPTGAAAPPRREVPFPWLTVLSSGRPETVLDGFGCQPLSPGVYGAAPALRLRVVLLSELPRTRATLMLRMMGTRRVLREALDDLMALPDDAWERGVALPLLVHFGYELPGETPVDEEDGVIMEIQEWFKGYQAEQIKLRDDARKRGLDEGKQLGLDEGKQLGLDEGKQLGLDEGKQLGLDEGKRMGRKLGLDEGERMGRTLALARLFDKRLGRTMTDEERSALTDRFARLGEDRLDEVVLTLAGDALAAWLADPAAR